MRKKKQKIKKLERVKHNNINEHDMCVYINKHVFTIPATGNSHLTLRRTIPAGHSRLGRGTLPFCDPNG